MAIGGLETLRYELTYQFRLDEYVLPIFSKFETTSKVQTLHQDRHQNFTGIICIYTIAIGTIIANKSTSEKTLYAR